MPYVKPQLREQYDKVLDKLPPCDTAGQLGYVLARVIDDYLLHRADMDTEKQLRYQYQGEIFGLFEAIKMDFYRCVNAPYEDDVRARTGEVWKAAHRLPGHNGNPV